MKWEYIIYKLFDNIKMMFVKDAYSKPSDVNWKNSDKNRKIFDK